MAAQSENPSKFFFNGIINNGIISYTHKMNSKQTHAIRLMENLKGLLDENLFCDVDLIAGINNVRVSAQRIILIASSKYFRAMFLSGMNECEKSEIRLKYISGEALRLIIDYCYTGEIEINTENVEKLLSAASQLEFVEIEEECSKFLEILLKKDPVNCVSCYLVAQQYNFASLKKLSKQLMLVHFMEIKDNEGFLMLDFDVLLELVCSDKLNVQREEVVFSAVVEWMKYNEVDRRKHLIPLLRVMRFTLMEGTFLTKNVIGMLTSNGLHELCGDILNKKCDPHFKLQHIPDNFQKSRTAIDSIQSLNLKVSSKIYAFIWQSNELYKEIYDGVSWKAHPPVKIPIGEEIYAIAQWKTSLFVFGQSKRVVCMDMNTSVITSVPDIPEEREDYAVVIHDNNIYLIGGTQKMTYHYNSDNLFIYDILEKRWTSSSLPGTEPEFIATFVNDTICFVDGSDNSIKLVVKDTVAYEILEKRISRKKVKQLISNKDQLYVTDGTSIEKYDFSTETWTMMSNFKTKNILPNLMSNGIFSVRRILYFNNDPNNYSDDSSDSSDGCGFFGPAISKKKKNIEKYCPETNIWLKLGETANAYEFDAKFYILDQNN